MSVERWVKFYGSQNIAGQSAADLVAENKRLRKELQIVRARVRYIKKGYGLLREPNVMRFAFIEQMKKAYPIGMLCRVMRVSCRAWRKRPLSERARQEMVLSTHIRAQAKLCNFSYCRIRMTLELRDLGFAIGERRVARLMAANGIKVIRTHKYKRTTDSKHGLPCAPNLLEQDFGTTAPNQKWVGDISYIWTKEGWLYLAVVIDLFSRKVIGWAISDRLKRDLAISALQMAILRRRPPKDCIHHSDRGGQYCSYDYQNMLNLHDLKASMSSTGNCFDNAAYETFFKTIKAELIWREQWSTRAQAHNAIAKYIDGFYNSRRRHSKIGYISPIDFEEKMKASNREKYAA